MHKLAIGFIVGVAGLISGCSTAPDPAEICTAEWIAPRVDRAVKEIRRDTDSLVKTITRSVDTMEDGKVSAWNTYRMISAGEKYIERLKNSRGLNDMRILSETCDDPQIIRKGFADYLQGIDAPPMLVNMVRDADYFQFNDINANPEKPRR